MFAMSESRSGSHMIAMSDSRSGSHMIALSDSRSGYLRKTDYSGRKTNYSGTSSIRKIMRHSDNTITE